MLAALCASNWRPLGCIAVIESIYQNRKLRVCGRSLQLAALRGGEAHDFQAGAMPLRALLVDAAGTLILPSEPVAQVWNVTGTYCIGGNSMRVRSLVSYRSPLDEGTAQIIAQLSRGSLLDLI